MKTIRSINQIQRIVATLRRDGKKIALVPTMGFLHAGHLSLIKMARKNADVVVASIFVNPLQFGPKEDLTRYPRDEKNDLKKLLQAGVDYAFIPHAREMYTADFQTHVEVSQVTKNLCGITRPGHFRGVVTVVLKLFNIIQPNYAVFGKKDYQQLVTIRTMVRDLNLPVKIIGAPLVREQDGLAMSSRNVFLSPLERHVALGISRGLSCVKQAVDQGQTQLKSLKKLLLRELPLKAGMVVDYIEFCDAKDLARLARYSKANTLLAVAASIGKTRLIDNIVL